MSLQGDDFPERAIADADSVSLIEVEVALECVGWIDPAYDIEEDRSPLAACLEIDDLLVDDTEARRVGQAEVDMAHCDDETLFLFDRAGRADYLERGAAFQLT